MARDEDSTLDLIGSFYEAAADEERWAEALEKLTTALSGAFPFMSLVDKTNGRILWANKPDIDDTQMKEYAEHYVLRDPRAKFKSRS